MGLSSDPSVCSAAEQKGVVYLALHSWINVSLTLLPNNFRILKGLASVSLQGQEGSVGAGLHVSVQRKVSMWSLGQVVFIPMACPGPRDAIRV